jgi:hypothetical protein
MLTAAALGTLSRSSVLNKSVAILKLARSLASSGNLPMPAAGTCLLAEVEPCGGRRREGPELAGYKLSDAICTSCLCAGSAGRTTKKSCAPSLCRASEAGGAPSCRAAGAQQVGAGRNRAKTRTTPKKKLEQKKRPIEQRKAR